MPSGDKEIQLHTPVLSNTELMRILASVQRGELSLGRWIPALENAMSSYIGVPHAIGVSSGTAAIHLALLAAGVIPDSEVITSDLTFIAPANAIRYCGAWPIFIDCNTYDWQMDIYQADAFLSSCERVGDLIYNPKTHRRITAILPVHVLGLPVNMPDLIAIAARHHLPVIEDCAQSIGAEIAGKKVGSFGLLSAFSFNSTKTITGGGGGMVLTSSPALAARVRLLSNQGNAGDYIHPSIGFNYRLSNINAAIAFTQLQDIDNTMAKKAAIHKYYSDACHLDTSLHWRWLNCVWTRNPSKLRSTLAAQHIQSRPLWQPMHLSPAHRGAWYIRAQGISAAVYNATLSIPSSLDLTPADMDRVATIIHQAEEEIST